MNTNLEDLMYQAGLAAQGSWDAMDQYDRDAVIRFARLIVWECANRATWAQDTGEKDIGGEVLKHFGVGPTIDDQLRSRSTYFGNNS
jgi:hypothetical protein